MQYNAIPTIEFNTIQLQVNKIDCVRRTQRENRESCKIPTKYIKCCIPKIKEACDYEGDSLRKAAEAFEWTESEGC